MKKCSECNSIERTFAVIKNSIKIGYNQISTRRTYILDFIIRIMCTKCGNIEEKHIIKKLTDEELDRLCREVVYGSEIYEPEPI